MKIGLIARCEVARGLAIQSKNFYDHMPVDRVLLVKHPHPNCETDSTWYPGATVARWDLSNNDHRLDEALVREWLDGLDVVFSVETMYDWRLPEWARAVGCRTVVQGNPEFVRHGLPDWKHLTDPTEWWWPTRWRLEDLPAGVVMPVPMPNVPLVAAEPEDGPLKLLHIVGRQAANDRNGTYIFIQALANTVQPIEATIYAFDGGLPPMPTKRNVRYKIITDTVADRWEMYRGHHLLVLPRKYGGLCLPALEAAASGLGVMMTDTSPNDELASVLVPPRTYMRMKVGAGEIRTAVVNPIDLGAQFDVLARSRGQVRDAQLQSRTMVPRWDDWGTLYRHAFARLAG